MDARPHLLIHAGPDAGREIRIADAAGLRVGRSSKNGIVLSDPKTSRYHCRFFFRDGDGLWVSDLGSANQTVVNGRPVREVRLAVGDLVGLGDTVIKVVDIQPALAPTPTSGATVDLGLTPGAAPAHPPSANPARFRTRLGWVLGGVILLAIVAWLPKLLSHSDTAQPTAPAAPAAPAPLTVIYEKILGDTTRIFRYRLELSPDGRLVVTIDDTDTTHLQEEGTVTPALLQGLAGEIERSGFLTLAEDYQGLLPNTFNQYDLTVVLGDQARRVRVVNRAEPPAFQVVRERLENFAQIELGLWAVQYPPEKLIEMANAAYLDARKSFDERQVAHGNLARAIRRAKDAEFYLKTIEPKPEFAPALHTALADYTAELDNRYVDQNFLANRAVRAKEWEQAAVELRVLCEILGDRADPRYEAARQQLLDVETHLNERRK